MAPPMRLYAFGSNGSGQLGLDHEEDVSEPSRSSLSVTGNDEIPLNIAAGGNHTIVLLRSGAVYAAGANADGRCGLEPEPIISNFTHLYFPTQCPDESPVFSFCAATWEASILVGRDQRVYTCGSGQKGELGHGKNVLACTSPLRLPDFPPAGTEIVDLASCMSHTVAVLSNGDVYGWGNGRKGQLGQPQTIKWTPTKILEVGFRVSRAVCGREFTYLVSDPDYGHHAILGSDKFSVRSATPPPFRDWTDIAASWGSVFVLLSDGTLKTWGRNDHGQLAPPGLPPLIKMAVGSEHALGLTADGKVLAWGWGEHGNCGPNVDSAGDVKGGWKVVAGERETLDTPSCDTIIGAGCATSFICAG